MTKALKAIDTPYAGHLFRSRTEARWAVFFDHMGLQWQYESEGFQLPTGTRYLPDFRVISPGGNSFWFEVKPRHVDSDPKFDEFRKACEAEGDRAVLLNGTPHEYVEEWGPFYVFFNEQPPVVKGKFGLDIGPSKLAKRITQAAEAAQKSRFEHGATGR